MQQEQLLKAILEATEPDLASMQVFDGMALAVSNATSLQSLAAIQLTTAPLSTVVNVASKVDSLYYAGLRIASITYATDLTMTACTIDFNDVDGRARAFGFPRSNDAWLVTADTGATVSTSSPSANVCQILYTTNSVNNLAIAMSTTLPSMTSTNKTTDSISIRVANGTVSKVSGSANLRLLELHETFGQVTYDWPDTAHMHLVIDDFENDPALYNDYLVKHRVGIVCTIISNGLAKQGGLSMLANNMISVGRLQTGIDDDSNPIYLYYLAVTLNGSIVSGDEHVTITFEQL